MTDFITTLGANFVSLLTSGMTYLDPTRGGTCQTATDAKSVFDLGQLRTPAIVVVLVNMTPNGARKTPLGRMVTEVTLTWRLYLVGANFNRADGDGREGVLGEPGTNQMIADVIKFCHGKYVVNPQDQLPDARLSPSTLVWMGDTNSRIIYQFDWQHGFVLQEEGTGAWAVP